MEKEKKLKILFITGATHKKYMRNLNHFQRVYFLSRWSDLSILASKNSDFSASAFPGTKIFRSLFTNKVASLIYFVFWFLVRGRKSHFDLVITEPSLYSICGFWAKIILNIKWIVDVWDIPIRCRLDAVLVRLKTRAERWILKILFRWTDLFIVSILPEYDLKYFKLPPDKMLLLKNAIWLDEFAKKEYSPSLEGPFKILCARSSYSIHSGLDILAQAYREIYQDLYVSLIIIGKIPEEVRSQLDVLNGCPRVYFYEFIEHDQLLEMMRDVSTCIIPFKNVPDLIQTYPVKVLEYMAQGSAIIASDIGGLARMIRHKWNGLLFRAGDPHDLARQIRALYNDYELRKKLSQNAQQLLKKKYDCKEKNEIILSHLKNLFNKKN